MLIKPIPGYETLNFATEEGEILWLPGRNGKPFKNSKKLVRKRQFMGPTGYFLVSMPTGKKSVMKRVSRLICAAFHGPPPYPDSECRHLNGRKTDNRPANLRWGSTKQNFADRAKHGTCKLNKRKVREIRKLLIEGIPYAKIAHVYRVSYDTIRLIAECLLWKREGCGITAEFREWQRKHLGREQTPAEATVERLKRKAKAS
jgi:hypothetical protein